MIVSELVEQIKAQLVKGKVSRVAWNRYRELLQRILDGNAVDPNEAESIVGAVGRTLDDIAPDVALYKKRVAYRAALDSAKKTGPMVERVRSTIEKKIAERNEVLARLDQELAELLEQAQNLEQVIVNALTSENDLQNTIQDPNLIQRKNELRTEIGPLLERERELTDSTTRSGNPLSGSHVNEIETAKAQVAEWKVSLKQCDRAGHQREYIEKQLRNSVAALEAAEHRLASAETELRSVRKQIAEVRSRQREVEQEALIP